MSEAFLLVIKGASVLVSGPGFGVPGEGWHATFHLLSGVVLLSVFRSPTLAYRVVLGFAIAYGFVAAAGAIDGDDVLGLIPIDSRDTFVHMAYVALALGVIALGPARRIQLR